MMSVPFFDVPHGDDLSSIQCDVVHLGDKDGRHSLVEGGAVHVDGGADGQHKASHPFIDLQVFLQTAEGDGQRARAGNTNAHTEERRQFLKTEESEAHGIGRQVVGDRSEEEVGRKVKG